MGLLEASALIIRYDILIQIEPSKYIYYVNGTQQIVGFWGCYPSAYIGQRMVQLFPILSIVDPCFNQCNESLCVPVLIPNITVIGSITYFKMFESFECIEEPVSPPALRK